MTDNKFIYNNIEVTLTGRKAERKKRDKIEYLIEVSTIPKEGPFETAKLYWVRPNELFIINETGAPSIIRDCFKS